MTLRQWLVTPKSSNPDNVRRMGLLTILVGGLAVGVAVGTLAVLIISALAPDPGTVRPILAVAGGLTFVFLIGVYFIARFWSVQVASVLLVGIITIAFGFSDDPIQVVGGRSLLYFAIPITMASVLISPIASFYAATLASVIILYLSFNITVVPNFIAISGFFVLGLVAWLSARSLEQALRELRVINVELDQRVADRTRELREALVREQAETSKNQAILSSIADGVIVFDNSGRAVVANPAIAGVLDQPPAKVLNRSLPALMESNVPPPQQESVMELMQSSVAPENALNIEWGSKTLSLGLAPLRSDAGEITGTVAVFRDVTREAEVSRMKSAFVSMVSHELRTPLNAIQGFAEILQESVYGTLNEKQISVANRILSNTVRLLGIVSDLLDQAHIEAGTLPIYNAALAPADLIDGVQSIVGGMAQSKGLQLETRIDPNLPVSVVGDAQRLNQVLLNLTTNAIKYTERGKVNIRLHRPDPAHWALEVTDTGPGIPVSAQSYIFEPFRQVDNTISRRYGGVGLGLSIVKRLVTLMNGEVSLRSEPGQGSTFTVVLPLLTP